MHRVLKKTYVNDDSDEGFKIPIYSERVQKKASEEKSISEQSEKSIAEAGENDYDFTDDDVNSVRIGEQNNRENIKTSQEHQWHMNKDTADEIIRNAEEEAEKIISNAYRSAEIIINHSLDNARNELHSASEQGYMDGFEEGKKYAESMVIPALTNIQVLADKISESENKMLENFKDRMFLIISEISKKIIKKTIKEDEGYIVGLFSEAMKDLKAEEFITVTVSEYDIDFVTKNKKLFLEQIGDIKEFKIISDKDAKKGTLIVETAKSIVDASADVQIENIDYLLEKMRNNLKIDDMKNNADLSHNDNDFQTDTSAEKNTQIEPNIEEINTKEDKNRKKEKEPSPSTNSNDVDYFDFGDDLMMSEEDFAMLNLS